MKKLIILLFILFIAGCGLPDPPFGSDVKAVGKITAPENNTFKIGVQNYEDEFKDDITDDKALQYKLGDKYIAFKPLGMKWDTTEFKTVASSLKDEKEYKEVFGKGIDLEIKTGERVWSKIITINSLKDLGEIPKGTEYLEIEFAMDTNFIIDGWNKNDKFEINDTVRVGDFSYLEPARAWTSSSTLDRVKIKSYFEKGKYVKQIPVEFLKDAEYPIWADADITYGTALEFEASVTKNTRTIKLDTDKFAVCWEDDTLNDGECRAATVSTRTINFGAASTFAAYTSFDIGACTIDTNKIAVIYPDGDLLWDGYARVATVSGTTIGTWGTAIEIETGDMEAPSCAKLDTDKFISCYNDETNSNTQTCVASTVSGTTVSPGTPNDIAVTDYYGTGRSSTAQLETDKFVHCFYANDVTSAICSVGTVSGTTIVHGTPNVITTDNKDAPDVDVLDTDKFVVTLGAQSGASTNGFIRAATVSTRAITYGTGVDAITGNGELMTAITKIDTTHFVITGNNNNDGDKGVSRYSSVDWADKSLTLGDVEIFETGSISADGDNAQSITLISSDKIVICFQDDDDSDKGKCIIGETPSVSPPETTPTINRPDVIWFD